MLIRLPEPKIARSISVRIDSAFELFAGVVREDELVNSLKPLLIVAVLAGIGYGVYVRINSGSDAPPPAGVPRAGTPNAQGPDARSGAAGRRRLGRRGGARVITPGIGGPRRAARRHPRRGRRRARRSTPPSAGVQFARPPSVGIAADDARRADPRPTTHAAAVLPRQSRINMPPHDPDPAASGRRERSPHGETLADVDTPPRPIITQSARRRLPGGDVGNRLCLPPRWRRECATGSRPVEPCPAAALRLVRRFAAVAAEQQQLNQMLDQVAGTVVYSTQHLLEAPLRSPAGRTAGRYRPALQRALATAGQNQRHRRSAKPATWRATKSHSRSVQRT